MKMVGSILCFLMVAGFSDLTSTQQSSRDNSRQPDFTQWEKAQDIGVRFWYVPTDSDSTQGPLIFLPVSSQDPRLDTRPAWVLYVSLTDMHKLLETLAQSQLKWKESAIPQKLIVDPLSLPKLDGRAMEIEVAQPSISTIARVDYPRVGRPLMARVYCGLTSTKARESMAVWFDAPQCGPKSHP